MCVKSSFWDHYIYLVKICYVDLFVGEFGIVYKAHYVKTMPPQLHIHTHILR